jgi:hypothetical protein
MITKHAIQGDKTTNHIMSDPRLSQMKAGSTFPEGDGFLRQSVEDVRGCQSPNQ